MSEATHALPNAEERTGLGWATLEDRDRAAELQERAFRDGAKTERERIAQMLREPPNELLVAAAKAYCDHHVGAANSVWYGRATNREYRCAIMRDALLALAAVIEADPT